MPPSARPRRFPRRRASCSRRRACRCASLLQQRRRANPFTEGSRELFDLAGQGRIDAFFLGGAQIDGQANINLVQAEGRRFPGSFGSAFMYQAVPNVILFREEHSKRVLVPKVDFISAAGTPAALLTGKALFGWERERRRFVLQSFHPGESVDSVGAATGFDYRRFTDRFDHGRAV